MMKETKELAEKFVRELSENGFFFRPALVEEIVKELKEKINSGEKIAAERLIEEFGALMRNLATELLIQLEEEVKYSVGYLPQEIREAFIVQTNLAGEFLKHILTDVDLLSALAVAKKRKSHPELLPLLRELRSLNQEHSKISSHSSEPSINVFLLCCPSKEKYQLTLEDGTKIPLLDKKSVIGEITRDFLKNGVIRKAITGGNEKC